MVVVGYSGWLPADINDYLQSPQDQQALLVFGYLIVTVVVSQSACVQSNTNATGDVQQIGPATVVRMAALRVDMTLVQ